ncbi:MAG TPA: SGNH/GDSL hydrolase family protein [Planctomycetota bacterium]
MNAADACSGQSATETLGVRPRRRRLLLKLLLVPASLLVALLAAEVWFRFRYPFAENTWPGRFDPAMGFAFQPDATIQRTDWRHFCVEQRTNSLGFLDRQPMQDLPAGTRRVVVLGDSFVEAVQVPLAEKFHVVLERLLAARGRAVATTAFGMSGCGTSNVLAFYEQLGIRLDPKLVILLFVNNDVANNSPLLEAVRHGWHPEKLPRLFFTKDASGFHRLPIAADWSEHQQPGSAPAAKEPEPWWRWSRLGRVVEQRITSATRGNVKKAYDQYTDRVAWLRQQPRWKAALEGWQWPDDLDLDSMTACTAPPPAFLQARELTEHALAALRDRVQQDGGSLLVVGCHHLGKQCTSNSWGRTLLPRHWLDVIEPMCQRLGLPFLDLHADFEKRGILDEVEIPGDGHWNPTGHANAAAAIDAFLQAHPELLDGD